MELVILHMSRGRGGRPRAYREDISCPACGSHHVVKCGKPRGKQRMLCRDCGKYFMLNALYHHHPKALKEKALKMYSNGMSMRAISRTLNIPLGTIFSWIKRYGRAMFMRLEQLWLKAREHNESVTRVVDEMWTYLFKRDKGFYKWVFTIFDYTRRGLYVTFWVGNRDEGTFGMAECFTAPGGRWVSDGYDVYLRLKDHTIVSPVNPNESFHSSLRDRLVRFKRATKAVNRSVKMMLYSIALVLFEKGLIPEFVAE
jgi:transposase-like protein/IS1 family transposase